MLVQQWPDLDVLLDRYAVAIDGQIYQDAFMEPLNADSEVFFMPRIEGAIAAAASAIAVSAMSLATLECVV